MNKLACKVTLNDEPLIDLLSVRLFSVWPELPDTYLVFPVLLTKSNVPDSDVVSSS